MLILTRRIGESLQIGDNVKITVLSVRGTQVQIGVEAPVEIAVHRQEIYERILRERGQGDANSAAAPAERPRTGNSKHSSDR